MTFVTKLEGAGLGEAVLRLATTAAASPDAALLRKALLALRGFLGSSAAGARAASASAVIAASPGSVSDGDREFHAAVELASVDAARSLLSLLDAAAAGTVPAAVAAEVNAIIEEVAEGAALIPAPVGAPASAVDAFACIFGEGEWTVPIALPPAPLGTASPPAWPGDLVAVQRTNKDGTRSCVIGLPVRYDEKGALAQVWVVNGDASDHWSHAGMPDLVAIDAAEPYYVLARGVLPLPNPRSLSVDPSDRDGAGSPIMRARELVAIRTAEEMRQRLVAGLGFVAGQPSCHDGTLPKPVADAVTKLLHQLQADADNKWVLGTLSGTFRLWGREGQQCLLSRDIVVSGNPHLLLHELYNLDGSSYGRGTARNRQMLFFLKSSGRSAAAGREHRSSVGAEAAHGGAGGAATAAAADASGVSKLAAEHDLMARLLAMATAGAPAVQPAARALLAWYAAAVVPQEQLHGPRGAVVAAALGIEEALARGPLAGLDSAARESHAPGAVFVPPVPVKLVLRTQTGDKESAPAAGETPARAAPSSSARLDIDIDVAAIRTALEALALEEPAGTGSSTDVSAGTGMRTLQAAVLARVYHGRDSL